MRVYKLYELRRYYNTASSLAFGFDTVTVLAITVIPWIISYVTYDFYDGSYTYQERPSLSFTGKVFLYLQKEDDFVFYTNIFNPELFSGLQSKYRLTQTSFYTEKDPMTEEDIAFHSVIKAPLLSTEKVVGFTIILLFDITSWRFHNKRTEVPLIISKSFRSYVTSITYSGDLVWSETCMKSNVITRASYKSKNIPRQITDIYSNLTHGELCMLEDRIYVPTIRSSFSGGFELDSTIRFSSLRISENPGFWYIIKFAWVQYLLVALAFFCFAEKMRAFVYNKQIVRTAVHSTISKSMETYE
uniref:Transmembrane protein 231 n=1 Tax=Trichobilharzia regenti TaxID=157069 RepID=A0AA85J0C6_TRIRE|nr:unnamed protein product [Trichobilharzia regenti]